MLFSLRRSLESRRLKLWAVVPPTSPVGRLLALAPANSIVSVAASVAERHQRTLISLGWYDMTRERGCA